MNIAIIGAGIGGLTTAIFLQRFGFNVEIYEQAEELKPIGAGIMLAHNAMQVFDKLGLKKQISLLGNRLTKLNITRSDLNLISTIDNQFFDDKFSVNHIAIQRGALQHILIEQLPEQCIHLNKKLVAINNSTETSLMFSDGSEGKYDVVIAADGIHSFVRTTLFPDSCLRDARQVCWRGIASISLSHEHSCELNEAWGLGSRFGFVKIAEQQVYWYALCNERLAKNATLSAIFTDYHPLIKDIINKTDESLLIKNKIQDLKPLAQWYDGNVVLLGDAAHATTPNMGQGACQAIEDAYALSHAIKKYPLNIALKKYQISRIKKVNNIVNMSWKVGKISHIQHAPLATLRNFLLRNAPQALNKYNLDKILTL